MSFRGVSRFLKDAASTTPREPAEHSALRRPRGRHGDEHGSDPRHRGSGRKPRDGGDWVLPGKVFGTQHRADPTSAQAEADLTVAYNDAAGRTLCPVSIAGNLGGLTLAPGLYKSTSSLEVSSGDLTLDAKGNANAVFIFQMASTLVTTAGRQVVLKGGAIASNVFWQVGSSATLGTDSSFKGTIMADQAVSLDTGPTLEGRALARIAAVTLDSNAVTRP
jgi:Ice-binding-like